MIYCVGRRDRYDAALEKGRFLKPAGAEEARAFILRNGIEATREVYGVEADWEADTLQLRDEPYRRLLKTAPIIGLPRGDADMSSA